MSFICVHKFPPAGRRQSSRQQSDTSQGANANFADFSSAEKQASEQDDSDFADFAEFNPRASEPGKSGSLFLNMDF